MTSAYFNTVPLIRWDPDRCVEYFKIKYRIDVTTTNRPDGKWFSTAKLRQLRHLFGRSTGEKIYIVIRDRLDREEEAAQSPMQLPVQSPALSPVYMPARNTAIPRVSSGNRIKSTSDTSSGIFSERSPDFTSPVGICKNTLIISDLVLNPVKLDFDKTDQTAASYLSKLKEKERTTYSRHERSTMLSFINEHPPLLWQNTHLKVFLAECALVDNSNDIPDVDDFIFMSPDQLDLYFPSKGIYIYSLLQSRFINRNTKKLTRVKTLVGNQSYKNPV